MRINIKHIIATGLTCCILFGCNPQIETTMNPKPDPESVENEEKSSEEEDSIVVEEVKPEKDKQEESAPVELSPDEILQATVEAFQSLEALILPYVGNDIGKTNHATLAFLRNKDYGYNSSLVKSLFWGTYAGNIKNESGIAKEETELYNSCEAIVGSMDEMVDPLTEKPIDIKHMAAIIDLIYTESDGDVVKEMMYDSLFCWGGDLEQFMTEASTYAGENGIDHVEPIILYTKEKLMSDEFLSFPVSDLLADVDGMNIGMILKGDEKLLSEVVMAYYQQADLELRYDRFIEIYGSFDAFAEMVDAVSLGIIPEQFEGNKEFLDFYGSFQDMASLISTFGSYQERNVAIPDHVRLGVVTGFKELIREQMIHEAN